jgi:predicted PurR-regulated permease PerM
MVLGGEQFARKLDRAFRNTHVHDLIDVYASVNNKVIRYLRVKTFFSFLTALISWIVMVSFGVDFAALIALFIFILDYLPNIGSAFAVLIPGSVYALQTANLPEALLIMVILTVLQNLIGNVIEPKMMSISLDLSPVVVLFSLFFWGWMWGVVGMMLSIPLMAILKAVMEHFQVTQPIAILMGNEIPEEAS